MWRSRAAQTPSYLSSYNSAFGGVGASSSPSAAGAYPSAYATPYNSAAAQSFTNSQQIPTVCCRDFSFYFLLFKIKYCLKKEKVRIWLRPNSVKQYVVRRTAYAVLCTVELRVFECKMIQRCYSTQKVSTPPQESCWLCDAAQVLHWLLLLLLTCHFYTRQ